MRGRIFLLFILFSITSSFFWEDEEKQLRQLQQTAEMALQKKDYATARESFEDLFNRISPLSAAKTYKVDWHTYVDIGLRLVSCYEELEQRQEAEKTVCLVLAKGPPEAFIARLNLIKIRLSATRYSSPKVYAEMLALASTYPTEHWSGKDLSFFHALVDSLDLYYDTLIAKAKRSLLAGFYEEAITLYKDILAAIEKGSYPKAKMQNSLLIKKLQYRLAEAYFLAANYERSLELCEKNNKDGDKIDKEMLYLCALCHQKKRLYEKSVEILQDYSCCAEKCDLDHYDSALFEIGYHYYKNNKLVEARPYFEKGRHFNTRSGHLAALYYARICLAERMPDAAEKSLITTIKSLNETDPLCYECFYLRGLCAYAFGEYADGKDYFERSLYSNDVPWWSHSLYHLGWCYLRLGEDPRKDEHTRLQLLSKAQECFARLQGKGHEEAACLSLAQINLLLLSQFNKKECQEGLETLLQSNFSNLSLDGQVYALLLRAEAASSFEKKESILKEATQDRYRSTQYYSQAWYCRGLNHFEQGLALISHTFSGNSCTLTPDLERQGSEVVSTQHCPHCPDGQSQASERRFASKKCEKCELAHVSHTLFEQAAEDFQVAFLSSENQESGEGTHILKQQAKAHIYLNSPTTALVLLEKLLHQFSESVEEREETLYLRGVIACQLPGGTYFLVAEDSFNHLIQKYPAGKHHADALYALGALYFRNRHFEKAKNTFTRLGAEFPLSNYAAASLFWAAESAAALKDNPNSYRLQIVEKYPSSTWAPEAYLRQFPFKEYLAGSPTAILHLKDFETRFPESPLLISVNYWLGVNAENASTAKVCLEKALATFTAQLQKKVSIDETSIHFYYQVILELAALCMQSDEATEFARSEQLLTGLIHDFSEEAHPLTARFKQKNSFPKQHEEAEFQLVRYYLKQGKDFSAQKMLAQMLTHYSESGIRKGYLLSQVWQEQGKLSLKCEDYATALRCFEISEACGAGFFSEAQELTLWLLQSEAYRGKKEYDMAMRLLSRVINAETASPLRLKAMYLRAEIYELEGRPELAMRQLEATSKKGGEWANKALEKLKVKYKVE